MRKFFLILIVVALCLNLVSCGPKTKYEEGYALGERHRELKKKVSEKKLSAAEFMELYTTELGEATEEYQPRPGPGQTVKISKDLKEFMEGYNDGFEGKEPRSD